MISVFFRCACPYVGYTLKQADYAKGEMHDCTPAQMTRTGHKLLHSSGSYLVLGRFEGKKYFHIRQTKSTAMDEQGRQIYTNLALVGSTGEDERTINRIAGYALLDEDRFYQEIASMMILMDGDFTVDFKALQAFLNRFDRDYQVETTNQTLKCICKEIFFAGTNNEVDFIVAEADWNYFVKQVGIPFRVPPYWFTYHEAKGMAESARLIFLNASETATVQESAKVEVSALVEPVQPQAEQELAVLREQLQSLQQTHSQTVLEKKQLETEEGSLQQKLEAAEEKLISMGTHLQELMEKVKKSFFAGVLVGLIGMALAVLIFGRIGGCTKDKPDATQSPTSEVTTQRTDVERGFLYA